MKPEELQQILDILDKAYEDANRKINHVMLVTDIDEDGNVEGEVLRDETGNKN